MARDGQLPRVGSAVIVTVDDRILLGVRAKEPNKGKWVLPGGKVEPFESIAEAARREVREETGLEVKVSGQLGTFEIINPPDEHRLIVFSRAEVVAGNLEPASDLSDLRFYTREELQNLSLSEFVKDVLTAVGYMRSASDALAA